MRSARRSPTSSSSAHSHQPSASLIPHDPTLLFTVAGMVPFKTYFTGEETPPFPRAVTVQKCVRAGGKHNDLDEIGRTKRHLTFFEMMGNFSFGDYFKEDACAWAWEFVTEVIGLPADRLWVTVHLTDDEAADIWENQVGVPADRIQRLDEDNYWKMGDVGPCGPCSEIFWDKGPEFGADGGPEHGDEDRFIEIWNLVFMQFDQQADGSKVPLPKPSIDTGMGLERTVSVLQGVDSVWDTDELFALQAAAAKLTGVDPATAEFEQLVSLRILADHARSTSLLVSDGVFPSNEARGYVLRRILRRAVRHAYILGVESAVMGGMVDAVIEIMGVDYPDLAANHQFVREVIDREEVRFRETLRKGQAILDEQLDSLADGAHSPVTSPSCSTTPTVSRSRSPRRSPASAVSRSTKTASEPPWPNSSASPRRLARLQPPATPVTSRHSSTSTARPTSPAAMRPPPRPPSSMSTTTPWCSTAPRSMRSRAARSATRARSPVVVSRSMSPTPGTACRDSTSTRSPAPAA